jgi:hypothetical protein
MGKRNEMKMIKKKVKVYCGVWPSTELAISLVAAREAPKETC